MLTSPPSYQDGVNPGKCDLVNSASGDATALSQPHPSGDPVPLPHSSPFRVAAAHTAAAPPPSSSLPLAASRSHSSLADTLELGKSVLQSSRSALRSNSAERRAELLQLGAELQQRRRQHPHDDVLLQPDGEGEQETFAPLHERREPHPYHVEGHSVQLGTIPPSTGWRRPELQGAGEGWTSETAPWRAAMASEAEQEELQRAAIQKELQRLQEVLLTQKSPSHPSSSSTVIESHTSIDRHQPPPPHLADPQGHSSLLEKDPTKEDEEMMPASMHQQKVDELVEQFNAHLSKCQEQAADYQATLKAHYEGIITTHQTELLALQEQNVALFQELDLQKRQLETMSQQEQDSASRVTSLQLHLQQLEERYKEATVQLESYRTATPPPPSAEWIAENAASAARIAQLEEQLESVLARYQELDAMLDTPRLNAELEATIKTQQRELEALRHAPPPADLMMANEAASARITELEQQLYDSITRNQELDTLVMSKDAEIADLRNAPPPADLMTANEAASARITELEQQLYDSIMQHRVAKLESAADTGVELRCDGPQCRFSRSSVPLESTDGSPLSVNRSVTRFSVGEDEVHHLVARNEELQDIVEGQQAELELLRQATPPVDVLGEGESFGARVAELEEQLCDLILHNQELETVVRTLRSQQSGSPSQAPLLSGAAAAWADQQQLEAEGTEERPSQECLSSSLQLPYTSTTALDEGLQKQVERLEEELRECHTTLAHQREELETLRGGGMSGSEDHYSPAGAQRTATAAPDSPAPLPSGTAVDSEGGIVWPHVEDGAQHRIVTWDAENGMGTQTAAVEAGPGSCEAVLQEPPLLSESRIPKCIAYLKDRCAAINKELENLDATFEEELEVIYGKLGERSQLETMQHLLLELERLQRGSGLVPQRFRSDEEPTQEVSDTKPWSPSFSMGFRTPAMGMDALVHRCAALEKEVEDLRYREQERSGGGRRDSTAAVAAEQLREAEVREQRLREEIERMGQDAFQTAREHTDLIAELQSTVEDLQQRMRGDASSSPQSLPEMRESSQELPHHQDDNGASHRVHSVLEFLRSRLSGLDQELSFFDPSYEDERVIIASKSTEREHLAHVLDILEQHLHEISGEEMDDRALRERAALRSSSGSRTSTTMPCSHSDPEQPSHHERSMELLERAEQEVLESMHPTHEKEDMDVRLLQERCRELEALLAEKENEVTQLNGDIDSLSERVMDRIQAITAEKEAVEEGYRLLAAQLDSIADGDSTSDGETMAIEAQVEAYLMMVQRATAAEEMVAQLESTTRTLQETLESKEAEWEAAVQKAVPVTPKTSRDAVEAAVQQHRVEELTAELEATKRRVAELEANETLLRDDMKQIGIRGEHCVHQLEDENHALEEELEVLQRERETEDVQWLEERKALEEAVQLLEEQMDDMSSRAVERIAALEAAHRELQEVLAEKESDLAVLRSHVKELQDDFDQLQIQQSTTRRETDSPLLPPSSEPTPTAAQPPLLCASCEALQEALRNREAEVEKQRENARQLQRSHDELSSLLTDGATEVQHRLDELHQGKQQLEEQCRRLEAELTHAKRDLQEAEQSKASLLQETEELRHRTRAAVVREEHVQALLEQERRQFQHQKAFASEQDTAHKRELERLHAENMAEMERLLRTHEEATQLLRSEVREVRAQQDQERMLAASLDQQRRVAEEQLAAARQQCVVLQDSNDVLRREWEAWMTKRQTETPTQSNPTAPPSQSPGTTTTSSPAMSTDARIAALVERNGVLESRYQATVKERDMTVLSLSEAQRKVVGAQREIEIREQGLQRLERELAQVRGNLARANEDMAQRVQQCQSLRLELEQEQEEHRMLAVLLEESQAESQDAQQRECLLQLSVSLLESKLQTIPTVLEDTSLVPLRRAHRDLMQALQVERATLHERCDTIEGAARTAMRDGERQMRGYEAALESAREEQEEMATLIVKLQAQVTELDGALQLAADEAEETRVAMEDSQQHSNEALEAAELSLVESRAEATALRKTVDRLRHTGAALEKELQQDRQRAAAQSAQQAESVEKLLARVTALEAARREERDAAAAESWKLRESNAAYQTQAETSQREAAALQLQVELLTPRLHALETAHAQRTAELLDAGHQLSSLELLSEKEGQTRLQHMEELQRTQQQLSTEVKMLQQRERELHSDRDRLTTELQHTIRELHTYQSRCTLLDKEHTTLLAQTMEAQATHEAALFAATNAKTDLEHQVSSLQTRWHTVEKENHSLREEWHSTQRAKAELEMALEQALHVREEVQAQLERRLAALTSRHQKLVEEDKANTKETQMHLQQLEQLREESNRQQETQSRLERQLEQNAHRNETLQQALQAAQQAHQNEVEQLRHSTGQAQQESIQLRLRIAQMEGEAQSQARAMQHQAAEMDRLKTEIQLLQQRLSEAETQRKQERELAQTRYLKKAEEAQSHAKDSRSHFATVQTMQYAAVQLNDRIALLENDGRVKDERLRSMREELEDTRTHLMHQKEQARKDLHALRQTADGLEEKLLQAEQDRDAAKEALRRHQQQQHVSVSSAKKEVHQLQQELGRAETELRVLQAQHLQLQELSTLQKHDTEGLQTTVAQLRRELHAEREALRETQQHRNALALELETLRREKDQERSALQREHELALHACRAELQAALEAEHAKTCDAYVARDKALNVLSQKGETTEEQEKLCRELIASRELIAADYESLQQYLWSIMHFTRQAAVEVGLLAGPERPSDSSGTGPSGDETGSPGRRHSDLVDVTQVLSLLLDDWHAFMEAAKSFGVEAANMEGLKCILGSLEDAVNELIEVFQTMEQQQTEVMEVEVEVEEEHFEAEGRTQARPPPPYRAAGGGAKVSSGVAPPATNRFTVTVGQRQLLQFIAQLSRSYTTRTQDHVLTMSQTLRHMTATAATVELTGGDVSEITTTGAAPLSSQQPTPAIARATLILQRAQVSATTSLLHRQTGLLLHAVHQVRELIAQLQRPTPSARQASPTAVDSHGDTSPRPCPPASSEDTFYTRLTSHPRYTSASTAAGAASPAQFHHALQRLRGLFQEAEEMVVHPFHSLLLLRSDTLNLVTETSAVAMTGGMPTAATGSGGGGGQRNTNHSRATGGRGLSWLPQGTAAGSNGGPPPSLRTRSPVYRSALFPPTSSGTPSPLPTPQRTELHADSSNTGGARQTGGGAPARVPVRLVDTDVSRLLRTPPRSTYLLTPTQEPPAPLRESMFGGEGSYGLRAATNNSFQRSSQTPPGGSTPLPVPPTPLSNQ